jgi:hypothetical protein
MGALSALIAMFMTDIRNNARLVRIWFDLRGDRQVPREVKGRLYKVIREKSRLVRSMQFLSTAHKLLHYWHVFHKPFAVIMFLVMFAHIGIYYVFRVKV